MHRLLIRRCSMSSIEEEDESACSDDDAPAEAQQDLYRPPSALEWDSELSESDNDDSEHPAHDDDEEQAAHRVMQGFMQSAIRSVRLATASACCQQLFRR